MENIERKKISYEAIIAGMLLKFESIDCVDFNLIIEYIENKANTGVWGFWNTARSIDKYVKYETNGNILLKDGKTLDYFIEGENCTLREKLLEIAGNEVYDYINTLDIEKYKTEKEKALVDNRERALKEANILLISDIQDDYDELIKYGFKNIDYFKSIIRADKYFSEYPEALKKYHIILKGNQNVQYCRFGGDVELDTTLNGLKNILVLSLYRYDYDDHIELVTYLRDNHRGLNINETTYQGIFDRIVENMLINHTLENTALKNKKFVPIQDYINPNRLPFPTKKSDLKVLYLEPVMSSGYCDRISNELGLCVEFKEDSNYGICKYVRSNLGKYDIIIVTRIYSGNLLRMNRESTEQCKDTGKELTLFVAQDDIIGDVDSDLADKIELGYVFGGNNAPDFEYHSKQFRILRQPIEVEAPNEYRRKYLQSKYSKIKGVIEASVNLYNQALLEINVPIISDLDFKSAEELDQDYVNAYEHKKAIQDAELIPIKLFDNIRHSIITYLNYKKMGLMSQNPNGLRITEGENGIMVENIYQAKTLCTIIFNKNYTRGDLRIFEIQTLSKKGSLSNPQTIGVYTSEYENLENIPNRPDKKQESALISIKKKIDIALGPLNEEASKKLLEQETQGSTTLSLKRGKKKRHFN